MIVTYEFRCELGETFDRRYPMGSAPDTVTCVDHGRAARRLPSRISFPAFPGSHNATYRGKQ